MNGLSDLSLETDDLITDLIRRKSFDLLLNKEFQLASKDHPLALVMIDIDHFKRINDTHGHPQGDSVLKEIGKIIRNICNNSKGYAAKYGGEELVLILPNFTFEEAKAVAERVRSTIENNSFRRVDDKGFINCTGSAGISVYPDSGAKTEEELVRQADEALYKAKRNGRNQVCLADGAVLKSEQKLQMLSLEAEYITDGSRCYLLRDSEFLLVVVHLKFTNRNETPTTIQIKTIDIQINNSWEKATRANYSHNDSIREFRGNINVRNQYWLSVQDDSRLDANDTQAAYIPFLLQKTITDNIEEVKVQGVIESLDGRSAKFDAVIPRYR
jgi:diguanylate cyclase (GGDEF)-like protein